jgi:3-dehydroquinate synthetase
MIKHGFLADDEYLNEGLNEKTIRKSGEIKRRLIGNDLLDKRQREQLNFGHTIGHALETVSNYSIPHGFAIAMGMGAEGFLLKELGLLPTSRFYRLIEELERHQLPLTIPPLPENSILEQIRKDKKGKFSLIDKPVEEDLIKKSLCWQL